MMINLKDYKDLTQEELDTFIATLTVETPHVEIIDDGVFLDGALLYRFMPGSTIDIEQDAVNYVNSQIEQTCAKHFLDRNIYEMEKKMGAPVTYADLQQLLNIQLENAINSEYIVALLEDTNGGIAA